MTSRRLFVASMLTLAAVPLLSKAQTCCAAGSKDAKCCASKLTATGGAVVVESNEKKTKIKIKCAKCGKLSDEIEIDTPTAGKPYTQDWTCPKCGYKQKITVEAPAA